jgi:hypothetical protein
VGGWSREVREWSGAESKLARRALRSGIVSVFEEIRCNARMKYAGRRQCKWRQGTRKLME